MLKIDLLPRQIAIARMNKILVALIIVLLLAEVAALGVMLMSIKGRQAEVDKQFEETKVTADQVRDLEAETQEKQGDLDPIQAKVDFIQEANECGEQYWDRFHAINEYISRNAQMTRFSLTGSNSVNFTVIVGDTTEAARFVLNLVHCPALENISVSGLPAGMSIEGAGGATGGGGFQPMGGPEMGMEPGMEEGMEPGMGAMGGMGGGPSPQASETGEITLDVNATLTEPVQEPTPSGGGGAAAGAGMGPGMGPGMGGGMEPGMEPGMGPPPGMEGEGMEGEGMEEAPMEEEEMAE